MTDETGANEEEKTEAVDEEFEEDELIESPLNRVLMVIFSPQLVFKSLSVKSRSKLDWIVPITLSIIVSLLLVNAGYEYIRSDQINTATEKIESNANLTDSEKTARIDRITEAMEKMAGVTRVMSNVGPVFGVFLGVLVIALAMKAVSRFVLGGHIAFGDAFRIGALGSMVTMVGAIVKIPLMFSVESLAQAKTSLGVLIPEGLEENFVMKLIDLDIFIIWYVIIISIGISVFTKKSTVKALIPLVVLWLVFRIVTISISGALSGLGS